MTDDEIFDLLEAEFDAGEVKTRPGDRGKPLSYIDAPTARRRLNQAVGRAGWECDVTPCEGGVKCSLTLRFPSGLELTRAALGGYPRMESAEDAFKGGDTDSFKRACVLFGVAAYLSDPDHVQASVPPPRHVKETNVWGAGARSGVDGGTAAAVAQARAATRTAGPPRDGRGLFRWLKDREEDRGPGILRYINQWGRLHDYPGRVVEWTNEQVDAGYAEAVRKIDEHHED